MTAFGDAWLTHRMLHFLLLGCGCHTKSFWIACLWAFGPRKRSVPSLSVLSLPMTGIHGRYEEVSSKVMQVERVFVKMSSCCSDFCCLCFLLLCFEIMDWSITIPITLTTANRASVVSRVSVVVKPSCVWEVLDLDGAFSQLSAYIASWCQLLTSEQNAWGAHDRLACHVVFIHWKGTMVLWASTSGAAWLVTK